MVNEPERDWKKGGGKRTKMPCQTLSERQSSFCWFAYTEFGQQNALAGGLGEFG